MERIDEWVPPPETRAPKKQKNKKRGVGGGRGGKKDEDELPPVDTGIKLRGGYAGGNSSGEDSDDDDSEVEARGKPLSRFCEIPLLPDSRVGSFLPDWALRFPIPKSLLL